MQDVVLVHLVQVDGVGGGVVEELGADGREGDGRVGEFPFAVGGGADGGAEGAAENLVAEADAAEADVGAVLPKGWEGRAQRLAIEIEDGSGWEGMDCCGENEHWISSTSFRIHGSLPCAS